MFRVWQHLVEWWLSWRRNMLKKCLPLAMAMNMMHRLVSQSRVRLSTVVTVPLNCTVSRKCLRKMWLLSCRFCLSSSCLSYNGNCSLPLSGYSWTTCSHWHEDFCCCCSRFGTVCHSLWLHHRHYRCSTLCVETHLFTDSYTWPSAYVQCMCSDAHQFRNLFVLKCFGYLVTVHMYKFLQQKSGQDWWPVYKPRKEIVFCFHYAFIMLTCMIHSCNWQL